MFISIYIKKTFINNDVVCGKKLTCGYVDVARRSPYEVGGLEFAVPVGGVAHDPRSHAAV